MSCVPTEVRSHLQSGPGICVDTGLLSRTSMNEGSQMSIHGLWTDLPSTSVHGTKRDCLR